MARLSEQMIFIGVFSLRDVAVYGPEEEGSDGPVRKRLLESSIPWKWYVDKDGTCVRAFWTNEELRISAGFGSLTVLPYSWVIHDLEHVGFIDNASDFHQRFKSAAQLVGVEE
jgi:hypothetical protein